MRVSKDSSLHGRDLWPSFETHRLRDAPQDEVGGILTYFQIRKRLRLGRRPCRAAVDLSTCPARSVLTQS